MTAPEVPHSRQSRPHWPALDGWRGFTIWFAISVHAGEPECSARNGWRGVVEGVEPIGDRVRVTVTGGPTVIVDVTPGAVADLRLSRGTGLWLSAKATELDVYPA